MTRSTKTGTTTSATPREEASRAAGRAAGYCWAQNPHGPGRCTWPPNHHGQQHQDVYARTRW